MDIRSEVITKPLMLFILIIGVLFDNLYLKSFNATLQYL